MILIESILSFMFVIEDFPNIIYEFKLPLGQ